MANNKKCQRKTSVVEKINNCKVNKIITIINKVLSNSIRLYLIYSKFKIHICIILHYLLSVNFDMIPINIIWNYNLFIFK
jgi:hypothetical protein